MKSFLKDYSRAALGNPDVYDPVRVVNEDLDKHTDWKIIQIMSSDNYHFYVVYEIKAPRKPKAKKPLILVESVVPEIEVAHEQVDAGIEPVEEKVWTGPTLEEIDKIEHPQIEDRAMTPEQNSIPKMTDLIRQVKQGE